MVLLCEKAPLIPPAGLSVASSSLSAEFSCWSCFRFSDRRWTVELKAFCCLCEHLLSARLLHTEGQREGKQHFMHFLVIWLAEYQAHWCYQWKRLVAALEHSLSRCCYSFVWCPRITNKTGSWNGSDDISAYLFSAASRRILSLWIWKTNTLNGSFSLSLYKSAVFQSDGMIHWFHTRFASYRSKPWWPLDKKEVNMPATRRFHFIGQHFTCHSNGWGVSDRVIAQKAQEQRTTLRADI